MNGVVLNTPKTLGVGVGLRPQHYREVVRTLPSVEWFEVHSENFFGAGGQPHYFLEQIRLHYPISMHGVGLSLGSADPLDLSHIQKLKHLIARYDPILVSEHLCWGSVDGRHWNDLLPLPYTQQALNHITLKIEQAQELLGRQILVENISAYVRFHDSTMAEWDFLSEVIKRSGCGLLCDVNNIYVNAINHDFDARNYLEALPKQAVQEIHLAGFDMGTGEASGCLIDTHGQPVSDPVWLLYEYALQLFGSKPTLIEWDTDVPPMGVLLAEANKARFKLEQYNYTENYEHVD